MCYLPIYTQDCPMINGHSALVGGTMWDTLMPHSEWQQQKPQASQQSANKHLKHWLRKSLFSLAYSIVLCFKPPKRQFTKNVSFLSSISKPILQTFFCNNTKEDILMNVHAALLQTIVSTYFPAPTKTKKAIKLVNTTLKVF